jgi:YidC/Oxa1 family membrane protein insertase
VWDSLVELVRATIFAGAHVLGGSLGASVLLVSALVRLALLPLMLRSARFARAQQAKLATLQPRIDRIKKQYQSDPKRMWAETQELYRANGVHFVTGSSIASMLIQLPLLGALFSAVRNGLGARVRFLWVADLSRADALLVAIATLLAGVGVATAPTTPNSPVTPQMIAMLVMGATLIFLWSASSAVALSVGAGSAVSMLQNWLLARDARRQPA